MRTFLKALACAIVFSGVSVPAYATDQNIPLQATVASFCKIAGSLTPADDAVQTIPVVDGFVTAGAITRTFSVVCNRASNLALAAKNGGLITSSSAAAGFDNIINYTTSASGFATIAAGDTATVAAAVANSYESLGTATRATPGSATITVTITPTVNTNPLVNGTYNDTVRLSITPQP